MVVNYMNVKLHILWQIFNQAAKSINQTNIFMISLRPHHSVGCHVDQKTREAPRVKEVSSWRK